MRTALRLAQFMRGIFIYAGTLFVLLGTCPACRGEPDSPGSAGAKVFLALGICLAAVGLVFYIVVKSREKE
jgi:hypothetical protein